MNSCNKVVFISLFGVDDCENNSRLESIVSYLNSFHVITSDFNHGAKQYLKSKKKENYTYIHTPSYKKNISIKRLYSHIVFARKLKKYLKNLEYIPGCIYCATPTVLSAYVVGKYCKRKRIKYVIDVIDLWPDSLFPISFFFKLAYPFLYFWKKLSYKAYSMADFILGESKYYVEYASKHNKMAPTYCAYLGVDTKLVKRLIKTSQVVIDKPENEIWICYGGNLGNSYDFEELIKSVSALNSKFSYKLLFVGDGNNRYTVEKLLQKYNVDAYITGFLNYADYLKYLSFCDIAINIFRHNTKVVHSYKFNDYVATNCFILNSLKGETAEMIEYYKIGLNFDFKTNSLKHVLIHTLDNWGKYKRWKLNNVHLVNSILNKDIIYKNVVNILLNKIK
jgi:hypothetical protein